MDSNQICVQIMLTMTIQDNGQTEQIKTNATGVLYKKGGLDVLMYDEQSDDNGKIKNIITIQKDAVSVKRTGIVQMHQKFQLDQQTENGFQHPHGYISMETYTNEIAYQPVTDTQAGRLYMAYDVKWNGQDNQRHHQFLLNFTEEDSQ